MNSKYPYIIVGGGLAGAKAVEGIREFDHQGTILLVGKEKQLPYDRPPLTKGLWLGKKKVEQIFLHTAEFYRENSVEILTDIEILALDAESKTVQDRRGRVYQFEKLLLATGGTPRLLSIPGGNANGICYFRYLDDYLRLRAEAVEGKRVVVIGGGFIGSEIAAALNVNKLKVSMIFPETYLVQRVFPPYLGKAIQRHFIERGVEIMSEDVPVSITKDRGVFTIETKSGKQLAADILIVGIGIVPSLDLAKQAGLKAANGIEVNEYLQTSHPDIFAAGDNAIFPYSALGRSLRVEHWDNALTQGKYAGRNMAGGHEPYDYMPYFFSDLFEFGYEAVGDVNSELETFADWQEENKTGVIYYLKDNRVRGVMLCNVWEKVDRARELIRRNTELKPESRQGLI